MTKIDTVESRAKLKPRHEPYWLRISSGCYLGFRKLAAASTGTWIARYRDDTGKRAKQSLGDFGILPPSQRFDAATLAASHWFRHLGRGGSTEILRVKDACEKWIEHKRHVKGLQSAKDAEARFKRWVYDDKIAGVTLSKLTRSHVDVWRATMSNTQVVINPHAAQHIKRDRSPATVNRDMSELRAALNFAHDNNWVTDDSAWRIALRPISNADRRRNIYLDRKQRKQLIEHVEPAFASFLTGLSLIPLRPGALAELKVEHFDIRLSVLTVGRDKHGTDRKIKLPNGTASMLAHHSVSKSKSDYLFTRADGNAWDRHTWKKLFKLAVNELGLPEKSTLYALRHSAITDLVTSGLDLLTTALISGTSVNMIERHYGHLRHDLAVSALEKLEL